jgi:hypothetical protein
MISHIVVVEKPTARLDYIRRRVVMLVLLFTIYYDIILEYYKN